MNDQKLVEFIDRWSTAIGLSIQHMITNLFSRLLPLVSGGLFGVGVYHFWMAETNNAPLSATMAVITAGGIEAVGFMASHRAIKAYADNDDMALPIFFVAVYLIVGGGALWFTDVSTVYKITTTDVFILVGVNYALIGMDTVERKNGAAAGDELARVRALEDEDRKFARGMKRQAAADRKAVKLAKVDISPPVRKVSDRAIPVSDVTKQASGKLSSKRLGQVNKIYGHFTSGQHFTVAMVAEFLKVDKRTARRIVSAGVTHGYFSNPKRGQYIKTGVK